MFKEQIEEFCNGLSPLNQILIDKKNDDLVAQTEEEQDKMIFAEMERLANGGSHA
jgi:hypothetical protein